MRFASQTKNGKLSVWLNVLFVLITVASMLLALVFKVLSFGDRWWDITVAVLAILTLAAFISGLVAWIKSKDRSAAVLISILISVASILFALLHSLWISD